MRNIFILFVAVLTTSIATAQDKNKKMTFEVDGKCEMCKMRIEKAALKVSGVKYAKWDIPTHELALIIDERKTNAMEIKSSIAAVGHDSKELKATQEAYDGVHACCKYREDSSDDSMKH